MDIVFIWTVYKDEWLQFSYVYKDGMTSVFICELYTRMDDQFSYVNCIQGWNVSVFICELYTRMEWLQFSYVNCMQGWNDFSFHMWTVYNGWMTSFLYVIWYKNDVFIYELFSFHMWTVYKDEWFQFSYVKCIQGWNSFHMWTVYNGMTSVLICELYTRMEWLQFSYVNCTRMEWFQFSYVNCIQGWNDFSFYPWSVFKDGMTLVFICLYTRMNNFSFLMWNVYKDGMTSVFICEVHTRMEWL